MKRARADGLSARVRALPAPLAHATRPRRIAVPAAREAAEPGRQGHRPRRVSRPARARHDVLRELPGHLSADHRHAARGRAQARRAAQRSNCACCSCLIDPERDTPAALRKLADERRIDTSRWTLAHADAAAVRRIAAALEHPVPATARRAVQPLHHHLGARRATEKSWRRARSWATPIPSC